MRSLIKTTILFSALALFSGCSSMIFEETRPLVLLTRQDTTPTFAILVSDMETYFMISERGNASYTENAFGAILVGRNFPFEKARELIIIAKRNYYKGVRYIALYDQIKPVRAESAGWYSAPFVGMYNWMKGLERHPTEKENFTLYIGVPTEVAIENHLKAWKEEEIEGLSSVASQKEFVDRIMNR